MDAKTLRIVSSNIRNNASDGANHWVHRRELWASLICRLDADLIGLQEVGEGQYDQVLAAFPEYRPVGVAKDDGRSKGEWSLILYRAERFELLAGGDFWLSETPDVPGTRSWDSTYVRICTWAKLSDRGSGRALLFANTHLDHAGAIARRESVKLIQDRVFRAADGAAVVLVGDFNCVESDEPYEILTLAAEPRALRDSYREIHPERRADEATYHAFLGTTEGFRFDWILHSADLTAVDAEIIRDHGPKGRFPSDHFPVVAEFRWT